MRHVKIAIRDMPASSALEEHIRHKADKLSQFYNRIQSFHVVVEIPQKHKRNGKLYNVRIEVTVPGKELVVNKKLDEDVYIAIRDAFDALLRQLETYVRKRRDAVHRHAHDQANYGHVSKLFFDEGYGFIQSMDGNELYFSNVNVAHPAFEELSVGDPVQFLGITGTSGWQAHRVMKEKTSTLTEDLDTLQ
jgi:ribosomal subunit interface protein